MAFTAVERRSDPPRFLPKRVRMRGTTGRLGARTGRAGGLDARFAAVWAASAALAVVAAAIAPATFSQSSLATMSPLAAVLAIAAMGQTLVVMTGGIDLSI